MNQQAIEDRLAEIVENDVTIMMRDGKPQITNPRGVAIKMVRAIARIEHSDRLPAPGSRLDAAARALAIHDAWGTPNDPEGKIRPMSDYTNLSARMAAELRKEVGDV